MKRERIVHLIGGLQKGGTEAQLFRLSTALRERGWPQSVISFESGGVWKSPLEEAGIPVFEIPRHPFKPWRHWLLWDLVRGEKPGIILSWSAHVAVYARWLAGVGPVRRIFNVRGDLTVDRTSGSGDGRLYRYRGSLERADFVVGNSRQGFEVLRRAGVSLPRCAVIENIIPALGRAKAWEPVEAPRIAAVGSLKKLKAYDVLLRSLGLLADEGRLFELHVAGAGPERPDLERLAARLGLGKRVKFLGEIDDAARLLASAHLFAHPSRTEGLSNAVLEAMGEGLPVIASRVGGNPEVVEEGGTGLLVPPDRPDLLAAALRRLIDDARLRERLGAVGLRAVRERCGKDGIVLRYEEIFRSLPERRR